MESADELNEQQRKERERKEKKEKKEKEKKDAKTSGSAATNASAATATANELGLTFKKSENHGEWYSELCKKGELIEYYDISGCYILRPWSFSMWESIQEFLDKEIKKLGVKNSYFPLFVSERALIKEKDHVEGFAPEVAWVTKSGSSDLPEPIALRPTSETVMYPNFSKWIRSHRDLPLKLNQWCNVVRWEFKHPTPFIRSREFLWQEGHTAFATKEEADKEVLDVLDIYRKVYEDLLAVPVIKGIKSEVEKFAGGLYTTTVEAFIPTTGRGIQGATSHCLGQNFAKMFEIQYDDADKNRQFVWQNSWGLTTRTIGVMIMVHSDDKGLVLPPRIAPVQVVVIPIPHKDSEDAVYSAAVDTTAQLQDAGFKVEVDDRRGFNPGFKYSHWELKGVPLRIEIGKRDLLNKQVRVVRRDNFAKEDVPLEKLNSRVAELLDEVHSNLLETARNARDACIVEAHTWDEFMDALNNKKMVLAPWCDESEVEETVKARTKDEGEAGAAKTLCMPLEQKEIPEGTVCFASGKPAKKWALWGRSY